MSALKPQIECQDPKLLFSFNFKSMEKIQNDSNQKEKNLNPEKYILSYVFFSFSFFKSGQHMRKSLGRKNLAETRGF